MTEKKILNSWKEISKYLGVHVRTAQRWEKKANLPVHRISKSDKASVMAKVYEIDDWMDKRSKDIRSRFKSPYKRKTIYIGSISIFIFLSLIIILAKFNNNKILSTLSDYEIKDKILVLYNESGKQLWSYTFESELDSMEYYKNSPKQNVYIMDIDDDGNLNVIFAVQTKKHFNEKVICFDHRGSIMWSNAIGKEIQYPNHLISPDFDINIPIVSDLDNDNFLETIIIGRHKIYFPCRVLILDHKGNAIGKYINSGHFNTCEIVDLENDGFKEIILGGVNNTYKKACIAVLDIRKIEGSSPQKKGSRYYSKDLLSGTEKYYILLPQNTVGALLDVQENIKEIDIFTNLRFEVTTSVSRVHFEFDFNLTPIQVYPGDEFAFRFNELKTQGKIQGNLSSIIDNKKQISEILFWDGKNWTKKPVMNKFWEDSFQITQNQN